MTTGKPDAATVIADDLQHTVYPQNKVGLIDHTKLARHMVADHVLAALKDAGFLLLHESDRERLIAIIGAQFADFVTAERAVAAVFDTLGERSDKKNLYKEGQRWT